MSKNFEEEYRQMIDSELPDLWSRIEAQLPKTAAVMQEAVGETKESGEITPVSETVRNGDIVTPAPETVRNEENVTPASEMVRNGDIITPALETVRNGDAVTAGRRKLSRHQWMPVAIAAAAAVLCVIAALPMLFSPRNTNTARQEMTDDKVSGGTDGGTVATAEDADMSYEMADETKGNDSSEDLSAPPEFAVGIDNMAPTAESMTAAPAENLAYDTDSVYGSNALQNEEEAAVGEDTPNYVQMEVRILDSITSEDGEVFYEAAVLQNEGNISEKGIRIYFRRAKEGEEQYDYADVSFRQGETYLLYLYGSNETLASYGIEGGMEDRNGGADETGNKDEELYRSEMYIVYNAILN